MQNQIKNQYFSEFPSGFSDLVGTILQKEVKAEILLKNNDFLLYKTSVQPQDVSKLEYFEVSYFIIQYFDTKFTIRDQINWCFKNIKQLSSNLYEFSRNKNYTFRIVESHKYGNKNDFNDELYNIEMELSRSVKINRGQPDFELRLIERDGYGFIGIRITHPAEYIDVFQRNSIRKEIAYLMNYLSEPSVDDVFLDPMCGGGIIPILRSEMGGYKKILVADLDLAIFKEKIKASHIRIPELELIESDIENLAVKLDEKAMSSPDGFVNKIVVDPPWGIMKKVEDLEGLYKDMMTCFYEITKTNGLIILLTPHLELVEKLINESDGRFRLLKVYKGRVSGFESSIMKVQVLE